MRTASRFVCVAVLFAGCASPQLATTADGRSVYFASYLRQRDSSQSFLAKMFLLRDNALTLIEDSQYVNPPVFVATIYSRAAVSADGSVFAINRDLDCGDLGRLSPCRGLDTTQSTVIQTSTRTFAFSAWAQLTANGHFAALDLRKIRGNYIQLFDLDTGTLGPVIGSLFLDSRSHTVSEDGTVFGFGPGGMSLIGPSQSGTLHLASQDPSVSYWTTIILAGDASRIVYEIQFISPRQSFIHVLDVKTDTDWSIGPGTLPSLAQDGRTFSYLRADDGSTYLKKMQVWLGDAVSGETHRLSNEPADIGGDQTITGDGSAVICGTSGSLISIDTMTGAVTKRLSFGGFLGFIYPTVPGSYTEALGSFPNGPPEILDGSIPVVALGPTPRGYAFQIPWEVTSGQRLIRESASPFEKQWFLDGFSPVILPVGPMGAGPVSYAIHQDWSGVVNHESPARPGEIIHLYGTGWGPVDGTVASGQPTPSDRLYPITNSCDWLATGPDVGLPRVYTSFEVPFAGLAPGLVGVYQFDFRIPPDWKDSIFHASTTCTSGGLYPHDIPPVDVQP